MSNFDPEIINPGTYLGTFGENVFNNHRQSFQAPLFHLNELGGAQNLSNVQRTIRRIFPGGKFDNMIFNVRTLGTTFKDEMLGMCLTNTNEKNTLRPILEKIVGRFETFIEGDDRNLSLRRYDNIERELFDNEGNELKRLIMSYRKGPNVFYNYITGHNFPPPTPPKPVIGTKVRISTGDHKKKKGVIIVPTSQDDIDAEEAAAAEAADEQTTKAEKKYKYKYTIQLDGGIILNGSLYSSTKNPGGIFRIIEGDGPRDIWERPGPPTQCNNAFETNKTHYDKNIFGNVASSSGSTPVPMRCYICFRDLNDDDAMYRDNQRMECEHIFPITESHLVWGTFLYSFIDKEGNGDIHNKHIANLKRLYAPVCNHCNIAPHKSSIPVLDVGDDGRFKVNRTLITALTNTCSGANMSVCMAQPVARSDTELHKAYLMQIFQPLVNAVNEDIKFHLGILDSDSTTKFDGTNGDPTHPKTIRKLFLCRYLFYLDKKALAKLKILCIGGENIDNQIKKMVKAKKRWNTLWKSVRKGCRKMYKFIKIKFVATNMYKPQTNKPSKRAINLYKEWEKIPEQNKNNKDIFEATKTLMKDAFNTFSRTLFPGGDENNIANKIFTFFTTKRLSSSSSSSTSSTSSSSTSSSSSSTSSSSSSTSSTIAADAVTPILPVSLLKQWGLENKQAELASAVMDLNTKLNVIIDTYRGAMDGGGKNKNLKFVQSGGFMSKELLKMTLEGIMVGKDDYDNNFSTLYLFLQKMYEFAASGDDGGEDDETGEGEKQEDEDDNNYEQMMIDNTTTIEKKLYITLTKMKINSDCFYESLIEDIYENIQGEIRLEEYGETNSPPGSPPTTPTSDTKELTQPQTVRQHQKQQKPFKLDRDKLKNWDMNLTIQNVKDFNKLISEDIERGDYFASYGGTFYAEYSGPDNVIVPDFFKFQINGDDV